MRHWLVFLLLAAALAPAYAAGPEPDEKRIWAFSWHDVRDDVPADLDPDRFAVSTQRLVAFFDYLKGNGFTPVSAQQLIDARAGRANLPNKAVVLVFDDGLASAYTRVFPLLRQYNYPAIMAVVTSWLDLEDGQAIDYGHTLFKREDFLTRAQIAEMAASGLVEIASHSDNLHLGVVANPQGNTQPAAVARMYDQIHQEYESDVVYHWRIHSDLARSAEVIESITGQRPRVMVWPYGAHNATTIEIAEQLGMDITMTLTEAPGSLSQLQAMPRVLPIGNPDLGAMVWNFQHWPDPDTRRIAHVDLDYLYSEKGKQQARNLDSLISRIYQLQITDVYLQAFADPDGDGVASELYFPNRHLPMRADLFNRVAWQLRTRAGVKVWAWMPVLAFRPPEKRLTKAWAVKPLNTGQERGDEYYRLSPFVPEARQFIHDIYEDLGRGAQFAGVLFHDDAYLRDTEDGHGGPMSAARREKVLIDFTLDLADTLREFHPELKTARNIYARPILQPESTEWFSQSLPAFLKAYDFTAVMAMPWMEGADQAPYAWLETLVERVYQEPGARERVVFEIQTRDWRDQTPLPTDVFERQVRTLMAAGAWHIAYYPDDFVAGHPELEGARRAFSASQYPYRRR